MRVNDGEEAGARPVDILSLLSGTVVIRYAGQRDRYCRCPGRFSSGVAVARRCEHSLVGDTLGFPRTRPPPRGLCPTTRRACTRNIHIFTCVTRTRRMLRMYVWRAYRCGCRVLLVAYRYGPPGRSHGRRPCDRLREPVRGKRITSL